MSFERHDLTNIQKTASAANGDIAVKWHSNPINNAHIFTTADGIGLTVPWSHSIIRFINHFLPGGSYDPVTKVRHYPFTRADDIHKVFPQLLECIKAAEKALAEEQAALSSQIRPTGPKPRILYLADRVPEVGKTIRHGQDGVAVTIEGLGKIFHSDKTTAGIYGPEFAKCNQPCRFAYYRQATPSEAASVREIKYFPSESSTAVPEIITINIPSA